MQLERQILPLGNAMALYGYKLVGNGQGTPRNLGRAKFMGTAQHAAIAGRANS